MKIYIQSIENDLDIHSVDELHVVVAYLSTIFSFSFYLNSECPVFPELVYIQRPIELSDQRPSTSCTYEVARIDVRLVLMHKMVMTNGSCL